MHGMEKIIFATRPSALARWQTAYVIQALSALHRGLTCEERIITTQGDKDLATPLPQMGGKGVFTQELEQALRDGRVQAAVHSLKDLPVEDAPGLTTACIPPRGEAQDVLISRDGYTLDTLPQGARLGTSSVRRAAQLLHLRPDLSIQDLRGNVATRLRKALAGEYDAIVLAAAGLSRLGLLEHVTQRLPVEAMLPAPGQGALAVQCLSGNEAVLTLLAALDDLPTRRCVTAERAFLQGLGGGCAAPVAALARTDPRSHHIFLQGRLLSPGGRRSITVTGAGPDPLELGRRLAAKALAQEAAQA